MALVPAIGPFEVMSQLGAGRLGALYRARDAKSGREVAVSQLLREPVSMRPAVSMRHPHIARLYGILDEALAQEYVDGIALSETAANGRTAAIVAQIIDAVNYAHERDVVHLALKPSNIRVGANGDVKILGFGLVSAFPPHENGSVGQPIGTPAYLSPEQVKGAESGKAADYWSVGCVVYELLCGTRLFQGSNMIETLMAILEKPISFDGVPLSFRPLLRGCLRREPDGRGWAA